MRNGKENKFYDALISIIWFAIMVFTMYCIGLLHYIESTILVIILFIPLIILFLLSLIIFISKWENILQSEDSE